ncbi:polysaccharide biosynthesis tyrosine autokinase [Paenarthrobacter sp. MSM-2-10-13]|uniref:polysaccharide biosynthesis tyrosine autokinase n=1 Tax=Paenarthrobacter sp. MSM-2-10-13 TaxID=2717318 RepID=UPI0014201304|nr:polysaccharide biosynthesis tyrosine autokinase [Paenarthrobacter sp. MSM-2-10-13]NHW47392.1 polysaccharide biosynthesis tyrosine autokinase [Paenarthrobacter sp. MSM-2-10-13]
MDLHEYIRILRRNWMIIISVGLVGLLVGGGASLLSKPTYTAETQLFVAIQSSGSVQELQQGNTFIQARVQSYVRTVQSPKVLQPAIDVLGLSMAPEQLAPRVKATADPNTVLITISVTDNSAVQAAAIAQAVADSLITTVAWLEKPQTGGNSPVNLSVIAPAKAPSAPSAPNVRMNLLLGLSSGLLLGLAIAIVRAKTDNRIRGEADLRALTGTALLGGISFDQDAVKKPLLTQAPLQSRRAETFRQLRTNLQFANVAGHARTVMVTSSLPGEGKSTTATNLAIAMAQAGHSVCIVDADLRRPMVSEYLGLDRNAGLTTALLGAADLNDLLQPWGEENLYVLASGQIPPNPSELLGSADMKQLLNRLSDTFDTVIIDTPPVLPVTDATVLAQHVDGVIVVVGAHSTRRHDLERSLAALELVDTKILGIVLNQLPSKGADAYSYSYERRESPRDGRSVRDAPISKRRSKSGDSDGASPETRNFGPVIATKRSSQNAPDDRLQPATKFPKSRLPQ